MVKCNYPKCSRRPRCYSSGILKKRCEVHLARRRPGDRARRVAAKHEAIKKATDRDAKLKRRFAEALQKAKRDSDSDSDSDSKPADWARKVAVMYFKGRGTDVNLGRATYWAKRAERGGCEEETVSLVLNIVGMRLEMDGDDDEDDE
jgi:hypothetical protein